MNLEILHTKDIGNIDKERIVLEVINDCDIGEYMIFTSKVEKNCISEKVKNCCWLPDRNLKKGDKVVIYTKIGENKQKENVKGNSSYFLYLNLKEPIWDKENTCAILMKIEEYSAKKINEGASK